jgi:glycosyltransferase involved in cell wall biosynthesis
MRDAKTLVVCLDERGALAEDAERAGARVLVVERKPGTDPGVILKLRSLFLREKIDVVHTHTLASMFYAGCAAWLAGVGRRLHTQHNTLLRTYGFKDRLRFRASARFFHHIVAVSEETSRVLAEYKVSPARRLTILNGIDELKLAAAESAENLRETAAAGGARELRLGSVARLAPEKGMHVALEAFSRVRDRWPASRLVIVGDGPERSALEEATAQLGIESCVDFLGYVKDVEKVFPTLDVFLLPSLTEGIPLALLEAMACGLPVVATAVGGVPEVVRHEESGILIPPGDPVALAEAMGRLLDQPAERSRLGTNARARVHDCFGLEKMAGAYRHLYSEVYQQRGTE